MLVINDLKNRICIKTLGKCASLKKKYTRCNNMLFMNKALTNAHKNKTSLRNRYLKNSSEENRATCSRQRNYCVSNLRKTKINYYGNLNHKDLADNKF